MFSALERTAQTELVESIPPPNSTWRSARQQQRIRLRKSVQSPPVCLVNPLRRLREIDRRNILLAVVHCLDPPQGMATLHRRPSGGVDDAKISRVRLPLLNGSWWSDGDLREAWVRNPDDGWIDHQGRSSIRSACFPFFQPPSVSTVRPAPDCKRDLLNRNACELDRKGVDDIGEGLFPVLRRVVRKHRSTAESLFDVECVAPAQVDRHRRQRRGNDLRCHCNERRGHFAGTFRRPPQKGHALANASQCQALRPHRGLYQHRRQSFEKLQRTLRRSGVLQGVDDLQNRPRPLKSQIEVEHSLFDESDQIGRISQHPILCAVSRSLKPRLRRFTVTQFPQQVGGRLVETIRTPDGTGELSSGEVHHGCGEFRRKESRILALMGAARSIEIGGELRGIKRADASIGMNDPARRDDGLGTGFAHSPTGWRIGSSAA